MTLMILAHPDFNQSIANKTIIETLQITQNDLEIRNIYQLYPDYQIDVEAEQAALLRHDLIILQYPMYWFNMPAILKIWFDQVFTYQFAYGSEGDKLKSKKLLSSLTVGQPEENFIENQTSLMDSFLLSINKSAEYTQMENLTPFILYNISTMIGQTEQEIQFKAQYHAQKLNSLLDSITSTPTTS